MKRRLIAVILAAVFILSFAGCNKSDNDGDKDSGGGDGQLIGVSMPTKSLQRWNEDGKNMVSKLEAAGYKVDLQYAGDNDIPTQVSQIENMITEGCKVLVIVAIDGSSLTEVLKKAKEQNIPVVAYDRLIMNTDALSYYATFDNLQVGELQGKYIEEKLDLKNNKGPFNIEFFAGDPADNNATYFFKGAMNVLNPYIESGVLKVLSKQTTQAQVSTAKWKTEVAQSRMENLITSNGYSPKGTKLDAVCCSNDSTAMGVTNALVSAGYTKDNMPIITGQDCDKANVKNISQGLQSMSVFKDTRALAEKVLAMVEAILKGTEPEINDTTSYNNGVAVIPSYLCPLDVATIDNYKKLLIDSKYYKESDIQ
jgi:putative multiple sugar transport system substrate-binding protein